MFISRIYFTGGYIERRFANYQKLLDWSFEVCQHLNIGPEAFEIEIGR